MNIGRLLIVGFITWTAFMLFLGMAGAVILQGGTP